MLQQKNEVQSMLEKSMFQATIADFWMAGLKLGVITTNQRDETSPKENSSGIPQFVIGVKGLAGFFGTSVSTVNRWKSSGMLDNATLQCGKVVIFELPKVIEILRVSDKKNRGLTLKIKKL